MKFTRTQFIGLLVLPLLVTLMGQGCGKPFVSNFSVPSSWVDDGFGNMVPYMAPQRQVRLLSPSELKNTLEDLTGEQLSATINYGDYSAGYDTGSSVSLDEGVLQTLMSELERISNDFVDNRLPQQRTCFSEGTITSECVESWLPEFLNYAFRGQSSQDDRDSLLNFYLRLQSETDGRTGLKLLVLRTLLSPKFLYRVEMGVEDSSSNIHLTDLEKASVLSYAITGSMPDKALLEDAQNQALNEKALRSHASRLLKSPRGRERVAQFVQSWFLLDSLNQMAQNPQQYAKFDNPETPRSLLEEFQSYVQSVVVDGDSRLDTLFLSPHTFVNRHTASIYGLSSSSSTLERVELNPQRRRGILTLASVMAVHSAEVEAFRDSPTNRGLLIKEQLLCESVGLPSGLDTDTAVQSVLERYPNFGEFTIREQLDLLMEQGRSCMECHAQFMPFGYLFGNYNALGEFVTEQKDRPIRSDVRNLDGGATLKTSYNSVVELIPDLAEDPRLSECFVRNLVQYTLGYQTGQDHESISLLMTAKLRQNSMRIDKLFEDFYSSPLLYQRRGNP